MKNGMWIDITGYPIESKKIISYLEDNIAGAHVLFLGTVRSSGSKEGEVKSIVYECYEDLSKKRLVGIGDEIKSKWGVSRIVLVHRFGSLKLGEISVAVGVSAPHREEAFLATRYGIECIKHALPIWKREIYKDCSSKWVRGVPLQKD